MASLNRATARRGSAVAGVADQSILTSLEKALEAKVLEGFKDPQASVTQIVHNAVRSAIVTVAATKLPETTSSVGVASEQKPGAIARPTSEGKCKAVWDTLDKLSAEGTTPTLEQVRKIARRRRWNANNARIEFYRWRNFHGIRRSAASGDSDVINHTSKPAAPAQAPAATH